MDRSESREAESRTVAQKHAGPGSPQGDRLSIEQLRDLVNGVRSISGVLRIARRLWENEISFDHGPEKVGLITRLIDQLPAVRAGEDGRRGLDAEVLRGLIRLYLVRSSQHAIGGVSIEAGEEDARRALALARSSGEQELELAALSNLGNALLAQHKLEEGAIIFRQEASIERERGNREGLARALYNLARALVTSGRKEEAVPVVREGLDLYEGPEGGDLPLFGKAFLLQIWQDLHNDPTDVEESIRIARQSIEILEQLDMTDRLITARLGLIRCYLITNDLLGGMEEVLKIERIATPSVSPFLQCQHMIGLTAVHSALQEWESAEEAGVRGLEIARQIGSRSLEGMLLERLAEIARRCGKPRLGIARGEEGLLIENQPLKRAHIFRLLADIHLDCGNLEEARTALQQGEELMGQIGQTDERGFFQLTRGRLLLAEGRQPEAEEMLRRIRSLVIPTHYILTQSHKILSDLYAATGRANEALGEYRSAHELMMRQEENRRSAQLLALRTQHELRWEHQQVKIEQEKEMRRQEEARATAAELIRIRERFPQIMRDLDELAAAEDREERTRLLDRLRGHFRELGAGGDLDLLRHLHGVDGDFAGRLVAAWPNLTSGQIRLASLIRAGLNSAEICNLLDISPDTLQMQRKRLRKRLHLTPGQSLEEKVMGI